MLRIRDPRQGWFDFFLSPAPQPASEILPILAPPPEVHFTTVTEDSILAEVLPALPGPEGTPPAQPPYREREWILNESLSKPFPVALFKIGHKWVSVVPYNLAAAARLENYKHSEAETVENQRAGSLGLLHPHDLQLGHSCLRMCLPLANRPPGYNPHFMLYDLVAPELERSFLYRHLSAAGMNVIVSPSLRRFAECEGRRMERNQAAYDMPEFVDDRPLYERIETGIVLRCYKAVGEFETDKFYLVTTAKAEDDFIRLHPLNTGRHVTKALNWGPTDGSLEDHFTETVENAQVYDPATSVVARFPHLIDQHNKKLDSLGFRDKLFLHAQYDAVQAAVKDHVYFGHGMRMGKSSLMLAWTQLKGSQRIGILSGKNVRRVIAKEAQRIGIQGLVIVNSFADLEKEGRYFLMTYDWLKGTGRGGIRDAKKGRNYDYKPLATCPHCHQQLVRPIRGVGFHGNAILPGAEAVQPTPEEEMDQAIAADGSAVTAPAGPPPVYTPHYGYMCINKECAYSPKHYPKATAKKTGGAAWADVTPRVLRSYIDLGRAQHWVKCVKPIFLEYEDTKDADKKIGTLFHGRCCRSCGYVAEAYTPMRARRVNHYRWGTWAVDEIHNMKSGYSTDQASAFMKLRAKHTAGLSGTLMPNAPSDPYWPLHWMFGGGSYRFPYFRSGDNGLRQYNADFTSVTYIYDEDNNVTGKKPTPYLKNIGKFHQMMAPKMLRRGYSDPLVTQSLEVAGLVLPEIDYQVLRVEPTTEQARLMVASIDIFQRHFEEYKHETEAAGLALNASRVLPLMMRLRVAATIPDRFNLQLEKLGIKEPIYTGQPGGAKLPLIVDLVKAKVRRGQKVVIFSFFKEMQRLLGVHLAEFNPIVFQTSWSEDERFEAIESFHTDDSKKVTIGSPLSFGEGVDLSPADVCICADLLWVPGKLAQAWSRILKALPTGRQCEIYRVLLHHSIDEHMWNIFYAKTVAQEQAFDRRIVTRRETAIDIQAFVDMVLANRTEINRLLVEERGDDELVYAPMHDMLEMIDDRD
jgi:hypothetical protein